MSGQADEMRRRIAAGEDIGAETWERIDSMSEDPVEILAVAAGCAGVILGIATAAASSIHARQEFAAALSKSSTAAAREFLEGLATSDVGRG